MAKIKTTVNTTTVNIFVHCIIVLLLLLLSVAMTYASALCASVIVTSMSC